MIQEIINTQSSIRVELSMLGTRLCCALRVDGSPEGAGRYVLELEGRAFTAYMRPDGVLQFGRLMAPVQAHTASLTRLVLILPAFQAGRMISYAASRQWDWRGGDPKIGAEYRAENGYNIAEALKTVLA